MRHVHSPKSRRSLAAASAARALLLVLAVAALAARLRSKPGGNSFGLQAAGQPANQQNQQRPLREHLSSSTNDNAELLASTLAVVTGPLQAAQLGSDSSWYGGASRTLSFPLCGGFAAQRAALVSGVALAAELNRTLVLPHLLADGGQRAVPFGQLYDADTLKAALLARGLPSSSAPPAPADTQMVRLDQRYDYMALLTGAAAQQQHVRVDCPLSKVPPDLVAKHEGLVLAALEALQPAARLRDVVARAQQRLQGLSGGKAYDVLHLRAERSWVQHCAEWEGTADGVVRDNCINNTASVGDQLALHNVDKQLPLLLLLAGEGEADAELLHAALDSLQSHSYRVVRWEEAVGEDGAGLAADEAALVGYSLALAARQFAGNSVSVFSALLVLQRWRADRFATYYNGGNIPLEALLPLFPMPWVFTYNDWSAGTEYEYMVKAAVTSAIQAARMKPFCMYSGSEEAPMHKWLVGKGVRIIRHDPTWKEALIREGRRYRDKYSELYSHLYRTDGALVGAFQRIDIPILPELDQYNYVLFTDCDVFFRQQMKLFDWGTPLPTALGLGFENEEKFPYNDGVMLWNMPYMRRTNAAFLAWILNQTNGLYFTGYGPVDQGAFNQYYEKEVKGKPISKNFNSKMYHELRKSARIVHFHGPKPNHYLQWFLSQKCGTFGDMCKNGYEKGGLCPYAIEYGTRWASEWPAARRLANNCINMLAGSFHLAWENPLNQPCQQQQHQPAKAAAQHNNHSAPAHAQPPPPALHAESASSAAARESSAALAAQARPAAAAVKAAQADAAGAAGGSVPGAAQAGSAATSADSIPGNAQAAGVDSSAASVPGNAQANAASSGESGGAAAGGAAAAHADAVAGSSVGGTASDGQDRAADAGAAAGAVTAAQGAAASDSGASRTEAVSGGAAAGTAGVVGTSDSDGVLAGDALGSTAGMGSAGIKTGRAQPGGGSALRNSEADAAGIGAASTGQAGAGTQQQAAQVDGTAGSPAVQRGGSTAGGSGGSSGSSNTAPPTQPAGTNSRVIVKPLEAATAEVDVRELLKPQGGTMQA